MKEFWRDIEEYEGMYRISNFGRVKSFYNGKEIIRKLCSRKNGYMAITLKKNNKSKSFLIHRLVAIAFILNPLGLPQVNHKDEDKVNNRVDNLEWCDAKYNMNYNDLHERITAKIDYKNRKPIDYSAEIFKINAIKRAKKFSKAVYQYDKNLNLIKRWNSTKECGRNGFNQASVWQCCHRNHKQHKGYIWSYTKLNEVN